MGSGSSRNAVNPDDMSKIDLTKRTDSKQSVSSKVSTKVTNLIKVWFHVKFIPFLHLGYIKLTFHQLYHCICQLTLPMENIEQSLNFENVYWSNQDLFTFG